MGIGATFSVFDSNGEPTEFTEGKYFCYGCSKPRRTIRTGQKGIIKPCECGSCVVFKTD